MDIIAAAKLAMDKLKEHDAKRKIIEAELAYVQALCPHPNAKGQTYRDYGGGSDYEWYCPDCRLKKYS